MLEKTIFMLILQVHFLVFTITKCILFHLLLFKFPKKQSLKYLFPNMSLYQRPHQDHVSPPMEWY